jgi:hypothetical protein
MNLPLETLTGFVYGTTPCGHLVNPASCCKSTVEDPRNLCSFRGEMTTLERAKDYSGFYATACHEEFHMLPPPG